MSSLCISCTLAAAPLTRLLGTASGDYGGPAHFNEMRVEGQGYWRGRGDQGKEREINLKVKCKKFCKSP